MNPYAGIEIDVFTKEQWAEHAAKAHMIVFAEATPTAYKYIDFVLCVRQGFKLMGYLTCRKTDDDTLYWQYGGTFPGTRGSSLSYQVVKHCYEYSRKHFKRAHVLIENTNLVMLKMAMRVGFRITGIKNFNGTIFLEHHAEFTDAV